MPCPTRSRRISSLPGGPANHDFPPRAIKLDHFRESDTHTVCSWKGVARYHDVVVDGEVNRDAAWYSPEPTDAARQFKGYVAFWRGVAVVP